MKKLLFTLFSLTLFITSNFAQDRGYVKMEITEVSTDNAEAAPFIEMMKGTETEYFYSADHSMVKANMMGGMVETTTIVNNSDESMTMYMNAMGNKMQIESSKEEREKADAMAQTDTPDFSIEYDENVTKEIMGYTCTKATLTVETEEDAPSFSMVMYVAKDLKLSNKLIQGLDKVEMEGFPLEYVMDTPEMKMTVTTVDFKQEVDDTAFEFNSRGYQKMTWEEFQDKMGAMGGGFGK